MSALAAIKDFPILSVCAFPLAWLTWYNNIIHIYSFVAGIMSLRSSNALDTVALKC